MIKSREDVTELIKTAKVQHGIKWSSVAGRLGKSKEWTAAACLGQMQMTKEQAEIIANTFSLPADAVPWLQTVPHKGCSGVPYDPLLYRLNEVLAVYGEAIKELVHEEFGDGIMSAIDFTVEVQREENPAGDRVKMIWSGKFLPYKSF